MARPTITELLGKDAESLLTHKSKTIPKESLHLRPRFRGQNFFNF